MKTTVSFFDHYRPFSPLSVCVEVHQLPTQAVIRIKRTWLGGYLSIYLSIYVPPYVLLVGSGAFNLISLIVKKECWLKSWNCVLASRPVRQGQWRWRRRWWENWRRSQFTPVMWPETRGWDSPIWHCRWQGDQAMDNSATVHSYISFSQPPPSDDAEIKARWT